MMLLLLCLNRSLSCQTSSKALDMSRRTARVSREGNFSNAVSMLCVIEISWLIVGSSGRKPDRFGVSKLFMHRYSYIYTWYQISTSRIFFHKLAKI